MRRPVALILLVLATTACGQAPAATVPVASTSPSAVAADRADPTTTRATPTPTPTATPTATPTSRAPSARDIRELGLCEALERDDLGYFTFPTAEGNACRRGDDDAEDVLLCDAIYDDDGDLRVADGRAPDDEIVEACPEPDQPRSDEQESERPRPERTATRAPAGPSGAAPVGVTRSGTWWQAAADRFSPANLWFFDPVGEALPYGWRKGYQPTGTITPYSTQYSFVYDQDGSRLSLSFPSGTVQQLTVLGYDSARDVLTVNYEGYRQVWVGCGSGLMPPVALAACR